MKQRPRTYGQARAQAARLRGQLGAVETAMKSPCCLVRWSVTGDGDEMVAWVTEGCEGERAVNVSALKREMKSLSDEFGPDILKSRKGKAVSFELPMLAKGSGA